jgi:hypothetical protein
MYQIALKERAMQQPKTKHDRSAYEQSVHRLASAMLGMGAAQDGNVGTNKSDQPEANQEHAERALASE